MKRWKIKILFCLLFVMSFPYETSAHSGRTDSYGGHNKTSNGTYHCHSGQCLRDAKEKAYEIAFPLGQEDGTLRENRYDEFKGILYERVSNGNIDTDEAEYMIPYLLTAYKEGFEDTYEPTFLEIVWVVFRENALFILIGLFFLFGWGYGIYEKIQEYRNNRKNKTTP